MDYGKDSLDGEAMHVTYFKKLIFFLTSRFLQKILISVQNVLFIFLF